MQPAFMDIAPIVASVWNYSGSGFTSQGDTRAGPRRIPTGEQAGPDSTPTNALNAMSLCDIEFLIVRRVRDRNLAPSGVVST